MEFQKLCKQLHKQNLCNNKMLVLVMLVLFILGAGLCYAGTAPAPTCPEGYEWKCFAGSCACEPIAIVEEEEIVVTSPRDMQGDAILYMAIASLLLVVGLTSAYMIGKATNNVRLIAWVNNEYTNVIVSILLGLFVLAIFIGINDKVEEYYDNDIYTLSFSYIDGLTNEALSLAQIETKRSLTDLYKTTAYAFIGTPMTESGGCGKAYMSYYSASSAHREMVVDLLTTSAISLQVQKYALYAGMMVVLTFALPVGILLRMFPGIRKLGNFLIAVAFAVGIIFPMTYVLNSDMHDRLFSEACELTELGQNDEVFPNSPASGCILSRIALIFPQAIFFPNISIVITGAFVAGLTTALEGIKT